MATDIIKITARKCSDKQQPKIAVGARFSIKTVEHKGKRTTLIVAHPKRKGAVLRISNDRFDWKLLTTEEVREEEFKEESEKSFQNIRDNFTFEEHMQIAFVPTVIAELAWFFADKVVKQAAQYRIEKTKKLSRQVKELRAAYLDEIAKDLDRKHIAHTQEQSMAFYNECQYDFTILWFTVNQQIKSTYPNVPYQDVKTDAYIAYTLCRYQYEHNKRMSAMITERTGVVERTVKERHIDALETCMDAYVCEDSGKGIDVNQHITTYMKIFEKNLHRIKYNLND